MSNYVLKVKSKEGQHILRDLKSSMTLGDLLLKLSCCTSISKHNLQILSGFPPKALDLSDESKTLKESDLNSGDTVIVVKNIESVSECSIDQYKSVPGVLMKKVVPADNSCLFTSIGYVVNGKIDLSIGNYLRQIIVQHVSADPNTYSTALLGKPNKEYCQWISRPESWGGAIEVSILSEFYGIEIAVVDTQNAIINRFGEDKKYNSRVFLIFDGIHYDPLYMELNEDTLPQTIFPAQDLSILQLAQELAEEAKISKQFTDVNKFNLKCLQCDALLTGQIQAQSHAKETGHTSFGEIF
ncbi:ubiquitin thioesterase OTU1-like [Ctenocephalides felis]|uniref:ubiquitin thioesterase OTU1-like n=1 Tax=Ctenocephalides felis TaxID=7515 RepID=UPI000E6E121F|nr:ubiquitin thioesterase OTU1-like [Ctenocephalides felis]